MFRRIAWTGLFAAGLLAAACNPRSEDLLSPAAQAPSPEPAAAEHVGQGPLPMPLSINEVMVAMIDFAADGIWRPAASETPLTARQWLLVEQDAINLVGSATLVTTAGAGANDAEWVEADDWRRWVREMQILGEQAREAAREKDQPRLKLIGDRLVEICQACHTKYKPGLPVMGVTRFPIYPKRDGT